MIVTRPSQCRKDKIDANDDPKQARRMHDCEVLVTVIELVLAQGDAVLGVKMIDKGCFDGCWYTTEIEVSYANITHIGAA